jgi:hypothetical protein
MDSLLQKTSSGNITEVIEDKNSSDSSSEEDWYDEETSTYEKIGMILIQYEDILDNDNLKNIVKLGLFKSDQDEYMFKKIAYVIKKYKEKVSYEIMNKIVEILTDKVFAINIASYEELIKKYESVIEDYYSVIKDESIIIYFDLLFEQSVKI